MIKIPLVSIIINNYNYGRFLEESISSALNQTYENVEVIAVDDGSADNSKEIIKSFGDRIISVFKQNGGQASALNAGFDISQGDLIIFLDSDDMLLPNTVREIVKVYDNKISKIHYRLQLVDANTKKLDSIIIPSQKMPMGNLMNLVTKIGTYPSPPTSGNVFSRCFLNEVMPIPEEDWRINADRYLIHLCPLFGEIMSIDSILGCYRVHSCNNSSVNNALDVKIIRKNLFHDLKKDEAVYNFANKMGISVSNELSLHNHGHMQARISSLLLDPKNHPFPKDTRFYLLKKSITAILAEPWLSKKARLALVLSFLGISILPISMAQTLIRWLNIPTQRPLWVKKFL